MGLGNYELKSIDKILRNTNKINVPFFQRPFSWKKTEQTQFLDDLLRVHEDSNAYFIGSIFFREKNNEEYHIIDGQQRITSATILIALIRDILTDNNDTRAKDIETKYIQEKDLLTQTPFHKLTLNDINLQFFRKYIQKDEKVSQKIESFKTIENVNDSNKLLIDCYKLYHKRITEIIKNKSHPNNLTYIIELLNSLLNKFQALTITVTDDDEAFTIFETLNDRGMDLTISDLLKNYLFSIIYDPSNETETRVLVNKWNIMVERLGKDVSGFFKHYWNSKNTPISEKEIYRVLKKQITNSISVNKFLDEIFIESEVYNYLLNPEHSYWNNTEIEQLLQEISILGIRQCLPVILSAKLKFTNDEFIKTLKSCIALSFQYSTVCNLHNNKLESKYSELSRQIRSAKIKTNSKVREILKEISPKNSMYNESFKNLSFSRNKTPRYILKKINDSFDKGNEIISSDSVTLEHIIPETPSDKCGDYFKDNRINHKEVVHKLYNMTILGDEYNRNASSDMFDSKFKMYKKSKLKLNEKLCKFTKWTKNEMADWGEYLLYYSKKIWKI